MRVTHGEAQSAESRKDLIHKMKIALKKLRETLIWLQVVARKELCEPKKLTEIVDECDQLIAIFVKSVEAAETRMSKLQQSTIAIRQSSIK